MSLFQRDIKPLEYGHSCVIRHDVAFDHVTGSQGTQASVGVLHPGRVIWLQSNPAALPADKLVLAYVDGIGIIELNPQCLSAIT